MKKEFVKCMMGICVIGMMSLGVYGCGAGSRSEEPVPAESEALEESEKADISEESGEPESSEKNEKSEEPGEKQEELSLIGEIKQIGDGQFRIVEAITGESEDGGDILAVPAVGGEVEEDDPKTIIYNKDTVFTFRTIRDGGASYEDRKGSADDLAEELLVDVKGYYEEDVFHAAEILISKVIL